MYGRPGWNVEKLPFPAFCFGVYFRHVSEQQFSLRQKQSLRGSDNAAEKKFTHSGVLCYYAGMDNTFSIDEKEAWR